MALSDSAASAAPVGCDAPFTTSSGAVVRCQSRLRSKCPSCAELYRGDWAAIARSGVFDESAAHFRYYLLTLTAPSFGAVHRVPRSESSRARKCGCGLMHSVENVGLRGVPLDEATYDYAGLVAWNRDSGVLWDRTRRRLRDRWESVEFFIVREWQDRGALHVHVLLRVARWEAPSAVVLGEAARTAEAVSKVDGTIVGWGEQVDAKIFRATGQGAKTIWYLSKALGYVLKDTGMQAPMSGAWRHIARLARAARTMRCAPGCDPSVCSSRVHDRFGARSHVVSASRRSKHRAGWSFTGLTRKRQRLERVEWARARAEASGESWPGEAVAVERVSESARRVLLALAPSGP